jgi:hypothetical protein
MKFGGRRVAPAAPIRLDRLRGLFHDRAFNRPITLVTATLVTAARVFEPKAGDALAFLP